MRIPVEEEKLEDLGLFLLVETGSLHHDITNLHSQGQGI